MTLTIIYIAGALLCAFVLGALGEDHLEAVPFVLFWPILIPLLIVGGLLVAVGRLGMKARHWYIWRGKL